MSSARNLSKAGQRLSDPVPLRWLKVLSKVKTPCSFISMSAWGVAMQPEFSWVKTFIVCGKHWLKACCKACRHIRVGVTVVQLSYVRGVTTFCSFDKKLEQWFRVTCCIRINYKLNHHVYMIILYIVILCKTLYSDTEKWLDS